MTYLKQFARKCPTALALYRSVRLALSELKFPFIFLKFKSVAGRKRFSLNWGDRYPCLEDKTTTTEFDRHYVYHTAWAARILAKTRPAEHVDISSFLYFATIVSAFVPVRFYDFRPADVTLPGLQTGQADLLKLPFENNSIASLSCMHVVEHIGLGRYGDPLDPEGDLKATAELKRVLSVRGNLLFVVPVGRPKLMFNAHRIYSYEQVIQNFQGLQLVEFSLIKEKDGGLISGASRETVNAEEYACGCFWFRKEAA